MTSSFGCDAWLSAVKFPVLVVSISAGNDKTFTSQSSRSCQYSEDKFASNFASVGVLDEVAEAVPALTQIVLDDSKKPLIIKGELSAKALILRPGRRGQTTSLGR